MRQRPPRQALRDGILRLGVRSVAVAYMAPPIAYAAGALLGLSAVPWERVQLVDTMRWLALGFGLGGFLLTLAALHVLTAPVGIAGIACAALMWAAHRLDPQPIRGLLDAYDASHPLLLHFVKPAPIVGENVFIITSIGSFVHAFMLLRALSPGISISTTLVIMFLLFGFTFPPSGMYFYWALTGTLSGNDSSLQGIQDGFLLRAFTISVTVAALALAMAAAWVTGRFVNRGKGRVEGGPEEDDGARASGIPTGALARAGWALVLLAGAWVAAGRAGLLHALRLAGSVPALVATPAILASAGAAVATWRFSVPPLFRPPATVPVRSIAVSAPLGGPGSDRARAESPEPARLADLVLPDEALAQVTYLIRAISDPASVAKYGASPPAGAIFHGPPGVGKTFIARVIATETGRRALVFTTSALSSQWMGESTQLIRDAFEQARRAAPCVVVFDEIDALAPSRSTSPASGSAAAVDVAQRIAEFLQQIEGATGRPEGIFIVGTTNHLDAVDPAVVSRLGFHMAVPLPDERCREALLRRLWPSYADPGVTSADVARITDAFSVRDLRRLVEAAVQIAAGEDAPVSLRHFERAARLSGPVPAVDASRRPAPQRIAPLSLDDVVLPRDVKNTLRVLIRILADPEGWRSAYGTEPPLGVILHGPPGTGKSMIARAIAGELHIPVLAYTGADVTSRYVGESTQLVRDMFRQARESAPCVLFIDEFEGLARDRRLVAQDGGAAADDALQRINQFLQELEGIRGRLKGVCLVVATNHLDMIDEAIRNRLGHHIAVPLPDREARLEILRRHWPRLAECAPEDVADMTEGLSARALRDLCETAPIRAAAEAAADGAASPPPVGIRHFRAALDSLR